MSRNEVHYYEDDLNSYTEDDYEESRIIEEGRKILSRWSEWNA